MTLHLADGELELPMGRLSFDEFRRWTLTDSFPERGRFDFLRGRVEADVSPESLFSHNEPKGAIYATVRQHVKRTGIGRVFGDRARVIVEACDLSAEPDMVFVSYESLKSGRASLTPKENRPKDAIEVVGPPDLVVEVLSDSSVTKDTRDLYQLYFAAGIAEYWLIDARGDAISFRLLVRQASRWREVRPDKQGFRHSPVLSRRFRLDREADEAGMLICELVDDEPL